MLMANLSLPRLFGWGGRKGATWHRRTSTPLSKTIFAHCMERSLANIFTFILFVSSFKNSFLGAICIITQDCCCKIDFLSPPSRDSKRLLHSLVSCISHGGCARAWLFSVASFLYPRSPILFSRLARNMRKIFRKMESLFLPCRLLSLLLTGKRRVWQEEMLHYGDKVELNKKQSLVRL